MRQWKAHSGNRRRKLLPWAVGSVLFLIGMVFFAAGPQNKRTLPVAEAPAGQSEPQKVKVVRGLLQPGETFSSLLKEYLSVGQICQLGVQSRETFPLSKLRAGQPYQLRLEEERLVRILYEIDKETQLCIDCDEDGFSIETEPIPYALQTEVVRAAIDSSLFDAVTASGEKPELAIALADIFAWDIDFIRDIRDGDRFSVLVEKRYREGRFSGYGSILAAEFCNDGKVFQAVRFQDGPRPVGYYTPEGESLRKAFLRAPLNFTRISSGYSKRRYHPVLHIWKPHLAIDYAAPTGTPIRTVGDGVVCRKRYDRANGNLLRIRHPNGYETTYIHMSRYARGMRVGRRVAQGEVIGYVGSTGIATGPHLDFRMFHNGKPINPVENRCIALPPVSQENQVAFQAEAVRLLTELAGDPSRQAHRVDAGAGNRL